MPVLNMAEDELLEDKEVDEDELFADEEEEDLVLELRVVVLVVLLVVLLVYCLLCLSGRAVASGSPSVADTPTTAPKVAISFRNLLLVNISCSHPPSRISQRRATHHNTRTIFLYI